jgi:hypothetical protein
VICDHDNVSYEDVGHGIVARRVTRPPYLLPLSVAQLRPCIQPVSVYFSSLLYCSCILLLVSLRSEHTSLRLTLVCDFDFHRRREGWMKCLNQSTGTSGIDRSKDFRIPYTLFCIAGVLLSLLFRSIVSDPPCGTNLIPLKQRDIAVICFF